MKKFYVAILVLFITSLGFGQTTIYIQDFETLDTGYTASVTEGSGFTDVFNRTVSNVGGNNTNVWAVEDTNVTPASITLNQIDVTGYSDFTFSIDMIAHHFNDWDNSDTFSVSYSLDGGATQNLLWVRNNGGTFNQLPSLDTDFDGVGDCGAGTLPALTTGTSGCTTNSDIFANFSSSTIALSGNSTLDITLSFEGLDSTDEGIYLDNILVVANSASSNPTIGFDAASSSVNETNSTFNTTIPVSMTNYDAPVTVSVSVSGGDAEPADYTLNTTSLTFNSDETLNVSLGINPDAGFDDETIILDIAVTSGTADLGTSQHTVTINDDETPPLPNIVINEILADPTGIDANGDGTVDTTDDEFVELVNNEIFAVDITGYTLSDGNSVRHIFGSVVIPAGGSVVVFGGGIPTGIQGISTVASTGSLGLNNTGDSVSLEDGISNIVATYTYGGEGNNDQSLGRNEDIFGDFLQHTSIQTNPVAASPGLYNTSGLPFSTITWKGFVDNDWANAANWSSGNAPTVLDDVLILQTTNHPTISASTSVNNAFVNPGAGLLINSFAVFTFNSLALESTSSSFSALKQDVGFVSGTVFYNRFVNTIGSGLTEGNDLISPPLIGQNFGDFAAANPDLATDIDGITKAFARFNNTTDTYDNYDTTSNAMTSIVPGQGFRAATTGGSTLQFEGAPVLSGNAAVTLGSGSFDKWNLIGNQFPAYLHLGDFLDANSAMFDPSFAGIYGYDGAAADGWTIWDSNSNQDLLIAPGQGFFVAVNASGTFSFNADMTRIGNTDDFILGRNNSSSNTPKAKILLSNEDSSYETNLYFRAINTRGLDPGYDTGAHFSSASGIFTHLVEDNNGIEFINQSLPINDLSDIVVPLGIKFTAQEDITISLNTSEAFPNNINVYLEDNVANTMTLLNSGDYTLTPDEDLNGTGRFFIHFSDSALSIPPSDFDTLKIFSNVQDRTIVVAGQLNENTNASIFDLQGRLVKQVELNAALRTQIISTAGLSTGVYVVQLSNSSQSKTEKVILR